MTTKSYSKMGTGNEDGSWELGKFTINFDRELSYLIEN